LEFNIERCCCFAGHLKKLSNSILVFNITTPFHKYGTITGRFGYSEVEKHLVAEVKGPSGGIGIEILFNILSFSDFDVKFSLETPMEFLTKALLIGKLKNDMVSKDLSVCNLKTLMWITRYAWK
jgi:hypothetical protein